mgnify:CR=1 FL=1
MGIAPGKGWDIPIGLVVYTADRRRLGAVTETDADLLLVEDRALFGCSYGVDTAAIERREGDALYLGVTMAEILARAFLN